MKLPRCVCCNSELTAPVLVNGNIYGYSCAAKVLGGKQARKYKLVKATHFKDLYTNKGYKYASLFNVGDKVERVYYDNKGLLTRVIVIEGESYIKVKRK